MSEKTKQILGSIGILLMVAGLVLHATARTQTQNSLQVGTFTLSVPSTNPAVTVNSPAKAGTMALLSDIPVTPPGAQILAGTVAVSGSVTVSTLTNPICTVTPRYTITATALTVSGVDYVCTPKN